MTLLSERAATVAAEWALWGKDATDTDYRLLRCSVGTFSPQDFVYAIDRYSPGTLDVRMLPQVTVSWLKNPQTGLPTHLGLAIHETAAADDPRTGHARSQFDAAGREVVYVRFFAVPYEDLAMRGVSYRQLYCMFQRRVLPEHDREPITADFLTAPEDVPPSEAESQFAVHVAAQLLTTHPVCILGASEIALDRRLRFLDLVMSRLTYGTRSQLSAATWVNSNFTGHKHRLFFASAARDDARGRFGGVADGAVTRSGRKPDVVVEWGRLETAGARDPEAINYLSWDGLSSRWASAVLRQDTMPVDLKDKHAVRAMLDRVHLGKVDKLTVPETLTCLGEDLRTGTGSNADLQLYIDNLLSKGAGPLSAQTRDHGLTLIGRYDLLAGHPRVWDMRDRLYEALMGVVLDGPVTYERYLRLQESTKTPLQQNAALLQALNRRRTEADPTWLLIRRGIGDTDEDLVNALALNSVPATKLATRLVQDAVRATGRAGGATGRGTGEPALRPEHGRLIFGPAVQYLMRYGRRDRAEFMRLGFLAPALDYYYPGDHPAQVKQAVWILRNVYGTRLGRGNIKEVLGGSAYPPTDALLAAVIELAPEHAEFAMTEYGRARTADLVPAVRKRRLRSYLYPRGLPRLSRSMPAHRRGVVSQPAVPPGVPPLRLSAERGKAIVLAIGFAVIVVMMVLIYASHVF
jgi:hypothetical protein